MRVVVDIKLKPLQKEDWPLTMAWRSNPVVYSGLYLQAQAQRPVTWEEHVEWNESRNADWRAFIIMYNDRPVGSVTIGQLDHWAPEIGFYIGETTLWGRGIGKEAVRQGLEYLKEYGKEYCRTTVLKSNERSLRLMKSLGFKCECDARDGEVWMSKILCEDV